MWGQYPFENVNTRIAKKKIIAHIPPGVTYLSIKFENWIITVREAVFENSASIGSHAKENKQNNKNVKNKKEKKKKKRTKNVWRYGG